MKFLKFNAFIFLVSTVSMILSAYTLLKMENAQNLTTENDVIKTLINRTKECVILSKEFTQKDQILALLDSLDRSCSVAETGSDDLRVKFVSAQSSIEHVLACAMVLGDVGNLIGIIHTPTPATPLCTQVDNIDDQLLDSSIRYDLEKLLTVRSRAVIIREYLENGGKLFVAYPKGGFEKRTPAQQDIYKAELSKYSDLLFDAVLSCTEIDPKMVGATYFFKDNAGNVCAFSIKSMQANNPLISSEWGLWFGKISNPDVQERVNTILDYLESCDGPFIRNEIASN